MNKKALDEQIAEYQAQKERERARQHKSAEPLPFNHALQSRLSAYERGKGPVAFPGEYRVRCKDCDDTGIIYVKEDYIVNGRNFGTREVQRPCPRCAPPQCAVCQDTGVISYALPADHPDFGRIFFCEHCGKGRAQAVQAQERALRSAELPTLYRSLTFATWDSLPQHMREGKDIARVAVGLWVTLASEGHRFSMTDVGMALGYDVVGVDDTPRNSIVLSGTYGTGKTGLVAAAINALALTGQRPLYTRVQDMLTSMKALMDNDDGERPEMLLDKVKRAPALVLDELSTNQTTAWRQDQLEELIRYRYGQGLPTLVTTNSSRDAIEREWGTRTSSALLAMAHFVTVGGNPLRNEGVDYGG